MTVPDNFKIPLNLTLKNMYQIEFSFVNSYHHIYYSNPYLSLSSVICVSYFTHESFSLCPVTILFATLLTFCIPYQMLLTSLVRKHLYSYISENNSGPSYQIVVATGYSVVSTGWELTMRSNLGVCCRLLCGSNV